MNRFIAILGCCLVIAASVARGDTLVTHAGQRHEGMLSIQDGAVKIGDNVVPLKNIRKLTRDHTAPSALVDELNRLTPDLMVVRQSGALSWNGSFIARKVAAMDDTKVSLEGSPKGLRLSTINTAAVFFGKISLAHALKLREQRRPGVLLASGDFVEGNLTVANGTLIVDSVLFGRMSYAVATEAMVLWLQKPKPMVAGFTIRTRDGSMLLVKEPSFKDGALILNGSPFHNYRIPLTELVQLQHGNAADVVTLAWKRFDQAKPEEKNIFLAREANLERMRDLRAQVAIQQSDLKLAIAKTQLADKKRGDIGAANGVVRRENSRLTHEWNKQYAEYVRAKSIVRSKSNQLRQKQDAVRRIRAEVDHWKGQTKKKSHLLEEVEKALTQADEKELKSAKGRRDAAKRQVDQSNRQVQHWEQRLQAEQQNLETVQKTIQNAKAQEQFAKAMVDATHRGKEDAKNKQRKGMDALRAANREYFSLLSERDRLQSDFNRRDTNKDGKLTLEELKNK
ncbi:hypothetical protein OAL58_05455 [Verrucomicrobia bacterium]|nr:hypothetical protein [Verrucomicrobiota bacterium]